MKMMWRWTYWSRSIPRYENLRKVLFFLSSAIHECKVSPPFSLCSMLFSFHVAQIVDPGARKRGGENGNVPAASSAFCERVPLVSDPRKRQLNDKALSHERTVTHIFCVGHDCGYGNARFGRRLMSMKALAKLQGVVPLAKRRASSLGILLPSYASVWVRMLSYDWGKYSTKSCDRTVKAYYRKASDRPDHERSLGLQCVRRTKNHLIMEHSIQPLLLGLTFGHASFQEPLLVVKRSSIEMF